MPRKERRRNHYRHCIKMPILLLIVIVIVLLVLILILIAILTVIATVTKRVRIESFIGLRTGPVRGFPPLFF